MGKFVNGGRYTVTRIGSERACLKDEMTEDEFETSLEAISKHCLLAWAMTYPKVQGSTESGTKFCERVIYMLDSPGLLMVLTCSSRVIKMFW